MTSKCIPLLIFLPLLGWSKPIDLVSLGKETFHTLGCAECHSEIADDSATKTGPNLYGLFQKSPINHSVIEAGENHKITLPADLAYFTRSVRQPNQEFAIQRKAPHQGKPYQPIMPTYPETLLTPQKTAAIFHYLKTLNLPKNQGPAKVLSEEAGVVKASKTEQDPTEILVTNRTRIFRARIPGSSARAIHVGTPSGLNYTFDPRTLTITQAWWGGFLNLKEELNGRASRNSKHGHKSKNIDLKNLPLINPRPVDLSFKSPLIGDSETIESYLFGEDEFFDLVEKANASFLGYTYPESPAGHPTFHYTIDDKKYDLTFSLTPQGDGLLNTQKFKTAPAKNIWRPDLKAVQTPQKITPTPASKLTLPKGYSGQNIPAPNDPHGRPQTFEPMGMATAPDGSLIVTTRTAGVWKLKDNTWTMIAEGLLDALGIIIEGDRLIIAQKPELTELQDLNKDGFFETYRTLSDNFLYTKNYHEYHHGPAKGKDGNYYTMTNLAHDKGRKIYKADGAYMGSQGGFRGWILQTTPEGVTTPFASGVRSPAGLATTPDGQLYYTENQGEYNGTSKLHLIKKGAYYGHPSSLTDLPGMNPESPEIAWDKWSPKTEKAIALLPHGRISNSPGSPTWDLTKGKFGPYQGQIFLGDQTLSTLFRVIPKSGNQAAVIPFGENFPSGLMRLCFNQSGDLYVGQTGRGWRAQGGSEYALIKLTYQTDNTPTVTDITRDGDNFTLHLSGDLTALPENYDFTVHTWSYQDKPKYGSPEHGYKKQKISKQEFDIQERKITLTLVNPPSEQIYHFESQTFLHNRINKFEAFYTNSL